MIDITVNTLGIEVEAPTPELIEQGAPPQVVARVTGGSMLPLADPQNPGQPIRFPSASINFSLDKAAALEFSKVLAEKAELLPDAPTGKIIQATSMAEADQIAKAQEVLKG